MPVTEKDTGCACKDGDKPPCKKPCAKYTCEDRGIIARDTIHGIPKKPLITTRDVT